MVPSVSFLRITDIILSNFGIKVSNVKKENKFLLSITVFARNHFHLKIEHSGQNFNSTFLYQYYYCIGIKLSRCDGYK